MDSPIINYLPHPLPMVLWSLVYGLSPSDSMVLWPLVYGLSPPILWSYGLWSMDYPLRFHGPMVSGLWTIPSDSMVPWPLVYGLSPPILWSYGLWSMDYPLRFHGSMASRSMASALWFYGVKFCDVDLHIYNLFTNFAVASTFCRRLSPA